MTLSQTQSYVLGFTPNETIFPCYVRGGAVKAKQLVALCIMDHAQISDDSVTVSTEPGGSGSVFANVTGTYSNDATECGIFGVMLDATADQGFGRVLFTRITMAWIQNSANSAIAVGTMFCPSTDGATDSSNAACIRGNGDSRGVSAVKDTRKHVGIVMQAHTSTTLGSATSAGTSAAGGTLVLFDGINGFGGANN